MVYNDPMKGMAMDDMLNYKKAFVIEDLLKANPRAAKLLSAKTLEEFDRISDEFTKQDIKKMTDYPKI